MALNIGESELDHPRVVLLVGGVGGAKLAYGLARILPPERLTIIVNTGDDFWHYGLRICPDLDTIVYTLSGLVNRAHGWGVSGDTFHALEALRRLGDAPWFGLGDQDLATHLLRTKLLRDGYSLTQIVQQFASALGVQCTILPMADHEIATMVDTVEYGEIGFQEYFVKHGWQPVLNGLRYAGSEKANLSAQIQHALQAADIIMVGPSNPWLSISPILSMPGIRQLIMSCDVPRVAITPIIGGQAVKGPTAKIMQELKYSVSAEAVMRYYGNIINGFVYDERDEQMDDNLAHITQMDTLMDTDEKRIQLAKKILNWIQRW